MRPPRFVLAAALSTLAAALLISPLPAAATTTATVATVDNPSVCQVVVPRYVVLRAHGIQDPYSVGAQWGQCPQWVRDSGYNTWLPDYGGNPLTWRFQRLAGPAVAYRYRNDFSDTIPLTAFYGNAPRVGDVGTGGDYFALLPGTYQYDHDATFGSDMSNNLGGVDLTASGGFVAKYWSKVAVAVTRSGRLTTVAVSGRRDGPVYKNGGGYVYPAPGKNIPASGGRVQVRRDGRLLVTLPLDRYGRARWQFRDSGGRHTYTARLVATAWNWAASAAVRT